MHRLFKNAFFSKSLNVARAKLQTKLVSLGVFGWIEILWAPLSIQILGNDPFSWSIDHYWWCYDVISRTGHCLWMVNLTIREHWKNYSTLKSHRTTLKIIKLIKFGRLLKLFILKWKHKKLGQKSPSLSFWAVFPSDTVKKAKFQFFGQKTTKIEKFENFFLAPEVFSWYVTLLKKSTRTVQNCGK